MIDLMDATRKPSPKGGWSCAVRTVDQAVVTHVAKGYLVHPSGVFDATGAYVPEAVHWRGRPLMVPPPFPETTEYLPGRWSWGGVLLDHFGHFLTESTGRLWALDALEGQVNGIVFLPERGFGIKPEIAPKEYQQQFFDLLGIRIGILPLAGPTRIERLEVPGPGFGIGPLNEGTAPFRRFIRSRFALKVQPQGGEDLYISRARLDAKLGGIVGESLLERRLAALGYEIYHPQEHGLQNQIARYKAARRIIAVDGSALHLLAYVARPDQQIAVIQRRHGIAPDGIGKHLAAFAGRKPDMIDVIARNWIRSDRGRVDNLSYGEPSFQRLGEQLVAGGYVPAGTRWRDLSEGKVARFMGRIQRKVRRKGLTLIVDAPTSEKPLGRALR